MKNDAYRIKRILEIYEQLTDVIEQYDITAERLKSSFDIQWIVTTPIYNIGEQVYGLSKQFMNAHPDIPWRSISGLRHRLVHDYEATNWEIISGVLFEDLPEFISQIKLLNVGDNESSNEDFSA